MLPYEHGGDIYGVPGVKLDFSVNTNPLGMPEEVKRAVVEHAEEYARYPDPACRVLTAKLAALHGVDASMVLCGNGAADLIFRLSACCKPRRALTLAPTFSEYGRAVTLFGGVMLEHMLRESEGFALTERILGDLTPDIDVLFLCNPNNPTGRLAPRVLLRRIAEQCRKNGTLFVLDECFLDFTEDASMAAYLREYPNLLILRAFTKLYAIAGLRLGYLLCADTALLGRTAAFGPVWSVSAPAQAAGCAALSVSGWGECTRAYVRTERAYMARELVGMGITAFPSDANFVLLKCEAPLHKRLLERGILTRSCDNFTGLSGRFVRIGLRSRTENMVLLQAVREVLYG